MEKIPGAYFESENPDEQKKLQELINQAVEEKNHEFSTKDSRVLAQGIDDQELNIKSALASDDIEFNAKGGKKIEQLVYGPIITHVEMLRREIEDIGEYITTSKESTAAWLDGLLAKKDELKQTANELRSELSNQTREDLSEGDLNTVKEKLQKYHVVLNYLDRIIEEISAVEEFEKNNDIPALEKRKQELIEECRQFEKIIDSTIPMSGFDIPLSQN